MCEGVAALVLKPAVLGGFERTAGLAAWARQRGMLCVLSSSFESCLGVAQLAQFAAALDAAAGPPGGTQHGLATLSWFAEDLLPASPEAPQLLQPLASRASSNSSSSGNGIGIGLAAAEQVAAKGIALTLGLDAQHAAAECQQASRRRSSVQTGSALYDFSLLEVLPPAAQAGAAGGTSNGTSSSGRLAPGQPPVLLLHGFLGAAEDWLPLMRALGLQRHCIAPDLPGHGSTTVDAHTSSGNGNGNGSSGGSSGSAHSLEAAAAAVAALVEREGLQGCCLVGYSLGARLALLLAARWPHLFSGVVSVSGARGREPERGATSRRQPCEGAMHTVRAGKLCAGPSCPNTCFARDATPAHTACSYSG